MNFHDFPWPLLFSKTFQAWKMVYLNSTTFHDEGAPGVYTESLAHTHPVYVDNCQGRRLLTMDDQNEVASHAHICTATSYCNVLTSQSVSHIKSTINHVYYYYLASAVAAVVFSQVTASSSASCSLVRPPSSSVSGHESTIWPMVCRLPQSQSSDTARPHLCKLARHGPWSVRKRFSMYIHVYCTSTYTVSVSDCHTSMIYFKQQFASSDKSRQFTAAVSERDKSTSVLTVILWLIRSHCCIPRTADSLTLQCSTHILHKFCKVPLQRPWCDSVTLIFAF